jgi:hypothetical protein
MHIRDGLNRHQRGEIEVLHITELLERFKRDEKGDASTAKGEEEEPGTVKKAG